MAKKASENNKVEAVLAALKAASTMDDVKAAITGLSDEERGTKVVVLALVAAMERIVAKTVPLA